MHFDSTSLTLISARDALRRGDFSARELVEACLGEIDRRDGDLGAFLGTRAEAALAEADQADLNLPLGGLPIALKDNLNLLGEPCSCGSKILEGYRAPYDATAVARLKAAGAIVVGRTNMDEFAMGSSTENSALGRTRNPHAPDRVPGGSSGGSAAAVGAGLVPAALGSDTGGSIRQPAAFCGCVGLKPTYGRVSRYGLVAYASSLDQIGPFTRTAADAALMLQAIAGHDPRDSTSLDTPVPDFSSGLGDGIKGLRIGLPKEYFSAAIDPAMRATIDRALQTLAGLGAELVELSLPHSEYVVASYYLIATAEASTNLARFDGVRYGHRSADAGDLLEQYHQSRGQGFGPEVKRRILLGTYVLSSGYYDAYYLKAQRVRTLIRRDFEQAFSKVDLIASPASPFPAFKAGEKTADPLQMYLADIFTLAANLAGIPGISLPCGRMAIDDEPGVELPVGLQLLGPACSEPTLLRAAHSFEQAGSS